MTTFVKECYCKTKTAFPLPAMWRLLTGKPEVEGGDNAGPSTSKSRGTYAERRVRTEKSRMQKMFNVQKRKLEQKLESDFAEGSHVRMSTGHDEATRQKYSAHLQHWFFTKAFFAAASSEKYQDFKAFQRDRARSIYSLCLALVTLLHRILGMGHEDIFHTVNIHIVDDTSTRLRGPSSTDPTTIYTIMNTVQSVHIRSSPDIKDSAMCMSFRVPTPLICLDNADAKTIYEAFIACALVTSKGIGKMWNRFGLQETIRSRFRTFVFIGDALKANDAAFKEEVRALLQSSDNSHLAMRLRCLVHQLALVREPVVLFVPRLWSTIVRLAHLFENLTFRKAFARSLAMVISSSFTCLQVHELPDGFSRWQSSSTFLRKNFRFKAKTRSTTFNKILDFLNGNLEADSIIHYCVADFQHGHGFCCESPHEALTKCLQLVVPFFARGFPTPLLYRFKHYDEAVSFITAGTCIHQLLIRALGSMGLDKAMDSQQQGFIDKLLGDFDLQSEGIDDTDAVRFMDNDVDLDSFQAQIAKRKQLVHQEITKPDFKESALLVDFVIKPIDGMINRLFKRNARLAKLTILETNYDGWEEDAQKSRHLFLDVVSGKFGWGCIDEYMQLISSGLEPLALMGVEDRKHFKTLFIMSIQLISDVWRRFVHEHCGWQFKVFEMVGTDLCTFVKLWDNFVTAHETCPKCFDPCFSARLLKISQCGKLAGTTPDVQREVHKTVLPILEDCCTFAALSSEPVEIKNGQVQNVASRRGNMAVKAPVAAKESSFLQAVIRDHELARHWVEEQTLPSKIVVSGILKKAGTHSSNQYSKPTAPWWFQLSKDTNTLCLLESNVICSCLQFIN